MQKSAEKSAALLVATPGAWPEQSALVKSASKNSKTKTGTIDPSVQSSFESGIK
jgi:hypothetical protein